MVWLLSEDVERRADLSLTASDFDDGDLMPDYVGYTNANENPELTIDGVPDDAESLVLVMDDPDSMPVVGFTFDHWLVWDLDRNIATIPQGWEPKQDEATEGYNDFVKDSYGGPSPSDREHTYRFKLLALDTELGLPPEARKAVIEATIGMEAEVLASTQLVGSYEPSQGM